MNARLLVAALWVMWAGCGPTPPPNTGGTAPTVGESCATGGQPCQPGLACNAQGVCDWASCKDAPEPVAWCAGQLGVEADRVVCEVEGCAVIRSGAGQPCQVDEGCHAGLVCEGGACVALCSSSASCPGADRACVERAAGSAQRICGALPSCETLPDPQAFCADWLGAASYRVTCLADGRCDLIRREVNGWCERDRDCQDGLVCEAESCEPRCEDACEVTSFQCVARPSGGEGRVCRFVEQGCAAVTGPDAHCELMRGVGSRCQYSTGECLDPPPRRFHKMLIQDVSDLVSCEQRTPEGLRAPGADIISVELFEADGRPIPKWLQWELSTLGGESNFSAPDLAASSARAAMFSAEEPVCPARRMEDGRHELDGMASLGCGGSLVVMFLADEDRFVSEDGILSGARLRIGEYAPVCDGVASDVDPDKYTVTLCEAGTRRCDDVLTPDPVSGTVWLTAPP